MGQRLAAPRAGNNSGSVGRERRPARPTPRPGARAWRTEWAYFFREAGNLLAIPDALQHPPVLDALEGARTARFSREEWDAYIAAGMAIQNERGALSFAQREGEVKAAARAVLTALRVRSIAVPDAAQGRILAEKDPARLERWLERAILAASVTEVIDDPNSPT